MVFLATYTNHYDEIITEWVEAQQNFPSCLNMEIFDLIFRKNEKVKCKTFGGQILAKLL